MRIVVSGLAARYPAGGVFWDYLSYAQGFTDLGHDVLYLEVTDQWFYDPGVLTSVQSGRSASQWLSKQIERSLPDQSNNWAIRDTQGVTFGADAAFVRKFCQAADLFVDVSGATVLQLDDFPNAHTVFVDSDPMYNQTLGPRAHAGGLNLQERARLEQMLAYDKTYSFGERIGSSDCLVPTELFEWHPTRQPVLTDVIGSYSQPISSRRHKLTTVGNWNPRDKPITVAGRQYFAKEHEFRNFLGLAKQSPIAFELALSGNPPASDQETQGWSFVDPAPISSSADSYLRFLANSFAEWSVAKHAYVASRSGWFSGRTAIYLALGVPAIVQDTGFSRFLPTGEGLLAFSTPDQALAAIEDLAANYERHCATALEIAHEYFDAKRVLTRLIDDVFSTSSPADRQGSQARAS